MTLLAAGPLTVIMLAYLFGLGWLIYKHLRAS